jgi:hypothetical protein
MALGKLSEAERALAHSDMGYLEKLTFRWALWLALGNTGGLVAFGNMVVQKPADPVAYLIFPSCWIFAVGLLAIGGSAWCAMMRFEKAADGWFARGAGLPHKSPPAWTIRGDHWLSVLSSVMFAAGILYPLLVVTVRYLRSGSFAG